MNSTARRALPPTITFTALMAILAFTGAVSIAHAILSLVIAGAIFFALIYLYESNPWADRVE